MCPEGEFLFDCHAPQGAVLALPHGSRLRKLRDVKKMREYAATHAESWFKYINGPRGRGLDGSVYLVTGWEKAKAWGMASFHSVSNAFQLSFRPTANGISEIRGYLWRGNPAQKKCHDPPTIHDAPWNQTLFIHGLSISLGKGIWAKLFEPIRIRETMTMESPLGNTHGNLTSPALRSLLSWFGGFLGGEAKYGKHAQNEHVALFNAPYAPQA